MAAKILQATSQASAEKLMLMKPFRKTLAARLCSCFFVWNCAFLRC